MSDPSSDHTALSSFPASSSSASLSALPPALLAVVCRHLCVASILRLLRCCAPLHRWTASDASFSRSAWSSARLHLSLDRRLHQWALPRKNCVVADGSATHKQLRIPLSVWQQALPVLRYTVQQWDATCRDKVAPKLSEALAVDQPTISVAVAGQQCTVLAQPLWSELDGMIPSYHGAMCYRSRFVLRATPHLQHLHLAIDAGIVDVPPAVDIFSFVPRLRSLHLQQRESANTYTGQPIVSILDVLALLPSLTSLRCTGFYLGVHELIDVAAHATLTRIRVKGRTAYLDRGLLGSWMSFDSKAARNRDGAAAAGSADYSGANDGFHVNDWRTQAEQDEEAMRHAGDMQRVRIALNRVKPSQRSIQARLALVALLHGALHPHYKLHSERPLSVLSHYRQQVAALRASLLDQLASSGSALEDEHSERQCGTKHGRPDDEAEASEEDDEDEQVVEDGS